MKSCLALVVILSFSLCEANGTEVPGPDPKKVLTYEQAVDHSEYIVVAKFSQFIDVEDQYTWFSNPLSEFQVVTTISGPRLPRKIVVPFFFRPLAISQRPKNWTIEDSMPKHGSKWILFLRNGTVDGTYTTYQGSFGRLKFSRRNVNMTREIVDRSAK
ncbi:MAG: hypothetical protein AB7W16_20235 [Candidatus Obscuribacterales bacterium]